jgi:hypothetical protein
MIDRRGVRADLPPVRREAGQARAGSTERDGNVQGARGPQEMRDLLRGVHLDDDFRDEAVETGVRAEGERPERVAENS